MLGSVTASNQVEKPATDLLQKISNLTLSYPRLSQDVTSCQPFCGMPIVDHKGPFLTVQLWSNLHNPMQESGVYVERDPWRHKVLACGVSTIQIVADELLSQRLAIFIVSILNDFFPLL